MERYLGKYSEQIYAVMRIALGFLFACHGAQKLFGLLGGVDGEDSAAELMSLYGLAGVIEFFGGLMICLGIYSGYAAFVASGTMAVAYFKAHFPQGFWPINNWGELAVVYSFVFLYIAARGPGIWSLESKFKKS